MDDQKQPGIKIDQIFLNRVRFEHGPDALLHPPGTSVELDISVQFSMAHSDDKSQGLLSVIVATPEDEGLYRFELEMLGLFSVETNEQNMPLEEYLTGAGAPTMFPFVREALANLTGRGRFGPVWLRPMNLSRLRAGTDEPATSDDLNDE